VTKQAYYKYDENALMLKLAQEEFVLQYIHGIRKLDHGIGGMKLWFMYQRDFVENKPVGRDRFEDIVDKYGLKVRNKIRKPKTTDSTHVLPTYPNLTKELIPLEPNQLWVSDITYITMWVDESTYIFCYLSLILDAYSEEIVGWSVGESLETIYPKEALKMALKRIEGNKDVNLIHHSDRGSQYASNEYVDLLKSYGISISMTENGDPKENAKAERINSTMKNELLKDCIFENIEQVREAVESAVEFYNKERPHMSIDMMTPEEAANCVGEIKKRWISYRSIAIKGRLDGLEIAEKSLLASSCQCSTSLVNHLQE